MTAPSRTATPTHTPRTRGSPMCPRHSFRSRRLRTLPAVTLVMLGVAIVFPGLPLAGAAQPETTQSVEEAGPDYLVQGDYVGYVTRDGVREQHGLQVVARGGGQFIARLYRGGLPGAGWDRRERPELAGKTEGGATTLRAKGAAPLVVAIQAGGATVRDAGGKEVGRMLRVVRRSRTLGASPPDGAIVLFDGKSTEKFRTRDGSEVPMGEGGTMCLRRGSRGIFTRMPHGSGVLHVEFRLPFEPRRGGQGRANSGCYLQSRFEVQILDSFGLDGKQNECGGIYGVGAPDVNMAFPPLTWQTYDIEFTAGRYDAAGKRLAHPRMTVRHNGVLVHDDREITVKDGARLPAAPETVGPGDKPLHFQDHGHEIQFRNIWFVAK